MVVRFKVTVEIQRLLLDYCWQNDNHVPLMHFWFHAFLRPVHYLQTSYCIWYKPYQTHRQAIFYIVFWMSYRTLRHKPLCWLFFLIFHYPPSSDRKKNSAKEILRERLLHLNEGAVASWLVRSSGPGSSPGRGHCVILGKTLNSYSASLHPGV